MIDDFDLCNGDINFSLNYFDINMDGMMMNIFFEGDFVFVDVVFDLLMEIVVFFGIYGIFECFDVVFVLLFVCVDFDVRL